MATSSGAITGDMKWLAYRYPQKPGTLMALGSILTQPDDLESSLNYETGIQPFPDEKTRDETPSVQRLMHAELSKSTSTKLRTFLPNIPSIASLGGRASGTWSYRAETTVSAFDIHAKSVLPGPAEEYIKKALQTPEVSGYLKKGLFSKPLYLVTGVATCKRLLVEDSRTRERGMSAKVKVSLKPAKVGAGASVGISGGIKTSAGWSGLENQEEVDFAYRVRKFQYSRLRKRIKKAVDVTDGALFGLQPSHKNLPLTTSEMESGVEDVPVFDGFESDDEDIDSGDIVGLAS